MVTTTPRNIGVIKALIEDKRCHVTSGSTFENAGNLPEDYIQNVFNKYAGTRLGRQELYAHLLEDVPGALWSLDLLEKQRLQATTPLDLDRIVVAIDPPVTSGENSDECGIIVAGAAGNVRQQLGHAFLLADCTMHMAQPLEWAKEAVDAYHRYEADLIIAEVNNGGDLVETVIRQVDPSVNYKCVRASRDVPITWAYSTNWKIKCASSLIQGCPIAAKAQIA